eukprot:COSAG06_NODE_610_length_13844_cov_14.456359_13_plen_101_part_00
MTLRLMAMWLKKKAFRAHVLNILHYQLCYTPGLHLNLTILLSASLSNLQSVKEPGATSAVKTSLPPKPLSAERRRHVTRPRPKMTAIRCRQCLPYVIADQ